MQKKIKSRFPKKLLLANPRGFCAGVKRAIDTLDDLVKKYPNQTIYCYHQIVHNKTVVNDFQKKGVVFVENLDEVPESSILVFSSHGVSPAIRLKAKDRQLKAVDATCPFVLKTHMEVKQYAANNYKIIYIGQTNHDETIGTTGEAPNQTYTITKQEDIDLLNFPKDSDIALVTQTTLSFDETESLVKSIEKKFPKIIKPKLSDICSATQSRQNGVKEIVKKGAQVVIVMGSKNSSNSNKLKTVAEKMGAKAYLVDDISEINLANLENINYVGLTAGASLPEYKVTEAIEWFKKQGTQDIEEITGDQERLITFQPQ
ncbi:MAG: 4-hydroxy-3-methylbut-2-enyl diphosphate reductase [Candidatus Daviesbacteria bacterium]|nr:4-hydroxy-3-methylbut-2-enyl diphosphate reductase [Candidatus Daviesbacteria bacterium]